MPPWWSVFFNSKHTHLLIRCIIFKNVGGPLHHSSYIISFTRGWILLAKKFMEFSNACVYYHEFCKKAINIYISCWFGKNAWNGNPFKDTIKTVNNQNGCLFINTLCNATTIFFCNTDDDNMFDYFKSTD